MLADSDFFEFIYMPDEGTNVLKNSTYIDTIPGIEFKKAFFGIWLSKQPNSEKFEKGDAWRLVIMSNPPNVLLVEEIPKLGSGKTDFSTTKKIALINDQE